VSAVESLELTGELTIQTSGERKAALVEALGAAQADGAAELDLDLHGVTELDTAGVQLLLMAQREAAGLGIRLRLASMSQAVSDVLAIARLGADLDQRLVLSADTRTAKAEERLS